MDMRARGHVGGCLPFRLFQLVDQVGVAGDGAQDAMGDRRPDDDGHPTIVPCAVERVVRSAAGPISAHARTGRRPSRW